MVTNYILILMYGHLVAEPGRPFGSSQNGYEINYGLMHLYAYVNVNLNKDSIVHVCIHVDTCMVTYIHTFHVVDCTWKCLCKQAATYIFIHVHSHGFLHSYVYVVAPV